jgi:hypothetical protein
MTPAHVACVPESWEEPVSHGRAGAEAAVLQTITDADCGIAIWQRPVETSVQKQATALARSESLALRLSLTPAQLAEDVSTSLTASRAALGAMGDLLEDIQRLAGHFAALASDVSAARAVTLRLEALHDDGCRRFHVDRVQLRLLCTYVGPGTEWLPHDQVDRAALPGHLPNEAILRWGEPRRLEPFWVAILKGDLYPGAAGRGQVHRSPPIAAGDAARLLLCLDV